MLGQEKFVNVCQGLVSSRTYERYCNGRLKRNGTGKGKAETRKMRGRSQDVDGCEERWGGLGKDGGRAKEDMLKQGLWKFVREERVFRALVHVACLPKERKEQ